MVKDHVGTYTYRHDEPHANENFEQCQAFLSVICARAPSQITNLTGDSLIATVDVRLLRVSVHLQALGQLANQSLNLDRRCEKAK